MSKQHTRLVKEKNTVYEIDENCMRRKKKAEKMSEHMSEHMPGKKIRENSREG